MNTVEDLNIYIPCCDESLPVVRINSYLFNKFWPSAQVHYLGFSKPEFNFYNENHYFHSMSKTQDGGASKWTRYIHDFLKGVKEKNIIFSIDDYWMCQKPNLDMLGTAHRLIDKNEKIGRFDLTFDSQVEGNIIPFRNIEGFDVVVKRPDAQYRVSTQPAIWSLEYLLQILDNDWSPWQFEIGGTEYVKRVFPNSNHTFAFSDVNMDKYPIRTIAKGAVSRHNPGKFNVLGFSMDTIKEMTKEGFFREEDLIWGQWQGKVPNFHDKGGYDFHSGFLDFHPTSKTHFKEYHCVYDDKEHPMLIVNLWDSSFSHTLTHPDYGYISTQAEKSQRGKKIKFVSKLKDFEQESGITIFTDNFLSADVISAVNSPIKIGWILEPPVVHPLVYDKIDSYINELDYLMTFSEEITGKYDNAKTFSWCSVRLDQKDWGLHEKNKLFSMIASEKRYAPGHKMRHAIASELSEKHDIDLWGGGFKKFPQHGKVRALKDYMFSIVIQNCQLDTFFTDFVDPLITGTIPIFWGTRNVNKIFNKDGIIFFDTIEELELILSNLKEKDYYDRIESVKENYNIAKNFWRSDDQLAEMIYKLIEKKETTR